MSQLAYPIEQATGINGQLADSGNNDVLTYNNPDGVIPFGRALEKIAGDADGVQLPDNDSADIVGFSIREYSEDTNYPANSAISALRKGRIYVEVEEAVTPDDTPHYRHAHRAQEQLIDFSDDFVAGNVIDLSVNGVAIASVPFNGDHATTAGDLEAAIEAVNGVASVTVNGNDFTVVSSPDVELEITDILVTGGASQAIATLSETVEGIPSTDRGKLRASTDGNTAAELSGARFLTAAAAGEVAVLDLNLP